MRTGKLPDEFGEILASNSAQQGIGEVVELHPRVVEVIRLDLAVREDLAMEPLQQAGLSGAVFTNDYNSLDSLSLLVDVEEAYRFLGQLMRRRKLTQERRTCCGWLERIGIKSEFLENVGHHDP